MDNLISNIRETAVDINGHEEAIGSSIKSLAEDGNKLRSYMILYILASKSKAALEQMNGMLPDIEKRLLNDIEDVCKQTKEILDGAETRAKWIKDLMDALGNLCENTDLRSRERDLHSQMKKMEVALSSLVEIRNSRPFEQMYKEQ